MTMIKTLFAAASVLGFVGAAIASPLDKPYNPVTAKPSCGNELKLATMKDDGAADYVPLDIYLLAEGIRPTPNRFKVGFIAPHQKFRKDDLGYLLAVFECKHSTGLVTSEVQLGIKPIKVKDVLHFGSKISVHKSFVEKKAAGTTCLEIADGKHYHYRAFWGSKDDGKTPVVVFKRPDGNPACFTRS